MGIKQLAKLLSDEAPGCIKEVPLKSLHGRKIAIDASMAIYQFLIAVRHGNPNNPSAMLTNAEGETTSHIQGFFNRTIRFMTEGVRPVYVFDGKPPNIKSGELVKRREKREKAEKALAEAKEEGDTEEQSKQAKRLVRAGQKENDDCKRLLGYMGIPVVNAPCEAEAQASALCEAGLVWAVGTEDMDALTFRCPILLRKMTFANASQSNIQQMNYAKAIEELGLTHDEFVDLCILLGCDYCDSIRGIGPKTALKLIREHGCIEKILDAIADVKKYTIPDDWIPQKVKARKEKEENDYNTDDEEETDKVKEAKEENDESKEEESEEMIPIYVKARSLFKEHEVDTLTASDLKWKECDADALTNFLVDEMGFNPDRVKSSIEKLQKAFKATSKPQLRMDSFFKPLPGKSGTKKPLGGKRKSPSGKGTAAAKKKGFYGKKK